MQAKIVLIGEGTVGKSTIRERYLGIDFREAYLQTVGADYTMKKQTLEGGQSLQLQIWDLAGQQGFYNIRDSFYKGADGIVLIFDVSQPKTVDGISDWVKEAKKNSSSKVPIVLVGNKIDLRGKNGSISYEEGLKLAKKVSREQKVSITYIESSAKTGENIDEIFATMASLIVDRKSEKAKKVKDPNFTTYYNEVKDFIQLYFFKMLDDGPACVSQTSELNDPELLIKMAIYYATALGQGSVANTGLFGPFPLPGTSLSESNNQSLVYSFVKTDRESRDDRMKRINFCFIVVTIDKNLMYQYNNNSIYRFFFNEIEEIEDVNDITAEFIYQLKENLLTNVFILNNPS